MRDQSEFWNELALGVAECDATGKWSPKAEACQTVTTTLIEAARQPILISLVRGYFEVAFAFETSGAEAASAAILLGIAAAQPNLPQLKPEVFEAFKQESLAKVGADGAEKVAPHHHHGAAPKGTLKVSSFLSPGMERPRGRKPRS